MFSSHTCWWKERSGQIMRVGEPREHTWSWRTAEQIKFSIHIQFMWVQVHLLLWDKVNLRIQYNIMTGVCVYILKSTIYSFNEGKWLIWSLMYESLQSIPVYSCTTLTLKATSYKRKRQAEVWCTISWFLRTYFHLLLMMVDLPGDLNMHCTPFAWLLTWAQRTFQSISTKAVVFKEENVGIWKRMKIWCLLLLRS